MNMKKHITGILEQIEAERNVRILYACESGSRSWGYASVDSDYDVRFIYVHPAEHYLSLDIENKKDTIQWPVTDILDISGWDARKTMQLLKKGNASVNEWLRSPTKYITSPEADKLRILMAQYYNWSALCYHYYNLAKSTWTKYLRGDTIVLKKYLYAVRPLFAVKWLEKNDGFPPLDIKDLLNWSIINVPQQVHNDISDLLVAKITGFELGESKPYPELSEYIETEIRRLSKVRFLNDTQTKSWEELNYAFIDMLGIAL